VANSAGPSLPRLAPEKLEEPALDRELALTDFARFAAPSFYITGRQPMNPGAVVLAVLVAVSALCLVLFGLSRSGAAPAAQQGDYDDPDQVDVIVIGGPAGAPVPAGAKEHVSPVHPTILVHLPRFGDQVGLIPNTPAGHLLYNWLAAFNRANSPALASALPNAAVASATAAQMQLRRQTGGLSLLSAKEVEPGILVFRLRDQTPSATEVLGTLQLSTHSGPAAIASFSLHAVAPPRQQAIK
jgi:hypothetical protein